jgi:hypothetical protein
MGTMEPQASHGTSPKGGIMAVDAVTAMITIGETVVGEEGGEGDEAGIMEVGTIDRHTGIGTATTADRYPPDDICDAGEADRGALHREDLGVGVFHEETTEPGVPPGPTCAGP